MPGRIFPRHRLLLKRHCRHGRCNGFGLLAVVHGRGRKRIRGRHDSPVGSRVRRLPRPVATDVDQFASTETLSLSVERDLEPLVRPEAPLFGENKQARMDALARVVPSLSRLGVQPDHTSPQALRHWSVWLAMRRLRLARRDVLRVVPQICVSVRELAVGVLVLKAAERVGPLRDLGRNAVHNRLVRELARVPLLVKLCQLQAAQLADVVEGKLLLEVGVVLQILEDGERIEDGLRFKSRPILDIVVRRLAGERDRPGVETVVADLMSELAEQCPLTPL